MIREGKCFHPYVFHQDRNAMEGTTDLAGQPFRVKLLCDLHRIWVDLYHAFQIRICLRAEKKPQYTGLA